MKKNICRFAKLTFEMEALQNNTSRNIAAIHEIYQMLAPAFRQVSNYTERFNPTDSPDVYKSRIQKYIVGFADDQILPALYTHLPSDLCNSMKIYMTIKGASNQTNQIQLQVNYQGATSADFEKLNSKIASLEAHYINQELEKKLEVIEMHLAKLLRKDMIDTNLTLNDHSNRKLEKRLGQIKAHLIKLAKKDIRDTKTFQHQCSESSPFGRFKKRLEQIEALLVKLARGSKFKSERIHMVTADEQSFASFFDNDTTSLSKPEDNDDDSDNSLTESNSEKCNTNIYIIYGKKEKGSQGTRWQAKKCEPVSAQNSDEKNILDGPIEIDFIQKKKPLTSIITIKYKIKHLKIPVIALDSCAELPIITADIKASSVDKIKIFSLEVKICELEGKLNDLELEQMLHNSNVVGGVVEEPTQINTSVMDNSKEINFLRLELEQDWNVLDGVLGFLHSTINDTEMYYEFIDSTTLNPKIAYKGTLDGQRRINFGGKETTDITSTEALYVLDIINFNWYIPKVFEHIQNPRYWHKMLYDQSIESDILLLDISNNDEYVWTTDYNSSYLQPLPLQTNPSIQFGDSNSSLTVIFGPVMGSLITIFLLIVICSLTCRWTKIIRNIK
ncbi:hypothetical protein C1645_838735 [Glomus cerebriforme]|uniref:Uncharacterized protein n=1 Tax=Glomus cerebriforme TaxID=658196 RepID=A0A397S1X3_9GLOM|nr:hypothetical protein C1645_838735 [Glomus cerebriforme]